MPPPEFLDLPLELRCTIYGFYFGDNVAFWTGKWIEGRNKAPKTWRYGLMYANKQIHGEIKPFFFNSVLEMHIKDVPNLTVHQSCVGVRQLPCDKDGCLIPITQSGLSIRAHMDPAIFLKFRRFRVYFEFPGGRNPDYIGASSLMVALSALPRIETFELQVDGNVLYCENIMGALRPLKGLRGVGAASFCLADQFAACLDPYGEYRVLNSEHCLWHQVVIEKFFRELQADMQRPSDSFHDCIESR